MSVELTVQDDSGEILEGPVEITVVTATGEEIPLEPVCFNDTNGIRNCR